jgi:hypothetical protein
MPSTFGARASTLVTAQLPWFLGYVIVIFTSSSYFLSYLLFDSWGAEFFYRLHFCAALCSYSIVGYKTIQARRRRKEHIGLMYCLENADFQEIGK